MAKKLKVGVIGVGGIAGAHFPGWKDSPHAELYALSDVSAQVLARVGAEQGVSLLYEDPYKLIADESIDIVDVCTPNMFHCPLTVAALEAGRHVICEKPLAPTPADIRKMIEARDKSGKLLMTAQHFRFQGEARALKAQMDAGMLGRIYHSRCWWIRRAGVPTTPGFILKKNSGGGPCIDIGVHVLDLTMWMIGNPKPVSVCGTATDFLAHRPGAFGDWAGRVPKEYNVEDFAAGFVRFDNGATMVLEVSWMLNHPLTGDDLRVWLYGDKGGALWPENEVYTTDNKTQQHFNTKLQRHEGGAPHAKECVEFAECVAKGKPSPVPAEQSLHVIAVLDGLYTSSKTKKEVVLDL